MDKLKERDTVLLEESKSEPRLSLGWMKNTRLGREAELIGKLKKENERVNRIRILPPRVS